MILLTPFALWPSERASVVDQFAGRFNSLATASGFKMGEHDRKIGKLPDPQNWPYHSNNNQVRRAAFELGYWRGYRENK